MGDEKGLLAKERKKLATTGTESVLLADKVGGKRNQRLLELVVHRVAIGSSTRPLGVQLSLGIGLIVLGRGEELHDSLSSRTRGHGEASNSVLSTATDGIVIH